MHGEVKLRMVRLLCCSFLLLIVCSMDGALGWGFESRPKLATPVYGQALGEVETLNSWKATARTTMLGNQLLTYLDLSNKSLAYNSTDKNALYRRGYLYGTIACTQSAISDLSKAISVDPYFAAAYCERGICYIDMKDYNRALSDLNRAIQLNPNSGDAVMARGRVWLATGKAQLALADFRWASQGNMKYAPMLPGEFPGNQYDAASYYIGSCYEAMDRPEDAVKYYRSSMKTQQIGQIGFLHRYADQPLDTKWRLSSLEKHGY